LRQFSESVRAAFSPHFLISVLAMSSSAQKNRPAFGTDLNRLRAAANPIVTAHDAELCDVELKNEPGGLVLRIIVEKAGSAAARATTQQSAVDLETCASISRELSPALDVMDAIPQRYSLEVGSPGLERALHSAADYVRFAGNKAKLKLAVPQRGQSVLVGNIVGASSGTSNDVVQIQDGGASYDVPFHEITSAHLVYELVPAQKPGSQNTGNKRQKKQKK
jgi:ribosome maturation factor RimP